MIRRIVTGALDTLTGIGSLFSRAIAALRNRWRESALCPHQSIGCKIGNRCAGCWQDGIW